MQKVFGFGFLFLSLFIIVSCGSKDEPNVQEQNEMTEQSVNTQIHNVVVEEKMDANNYTYLKVKEDDKSYWIAVTKMEINPGENISYSKFMEMKDFKSESLNKTFESILFVDDARKGGTAEQLKSSHQNIVGEKDKNINIEPLKEGYTVEQIYEKRATLDSKTVKVKGKVVKVNEGILGTNWVHIQDGTGNEGTHDLLVTTNESVKVGSVVVAEGKVVKDMDFGSGYFYSVLLENAKIKPE